MQLLGPNSGCNLLGPQLPSRSPRLGVLLPEASRRTPFPCRIAAGTVAKRDCSEGQSGSPREYGRVAEPFGADVDRDSHATMAQSWFRSAGSRASCPDDTP